MFASKVERKRYCEHSMPKGQTSYEESEQEEIEFRGRRVQNGLAIFVISSLKNTLYFFVKPLDWILRLGFHLNIIDEEEATQDLRCDICKKEAVAAQGGNIS